MSKVAAVIQGDCRGVTEKVINFYKKRADVVILSTWINESISPSILDSKLHIIKNEFPKNPGGTHRNYQRLSANKGLKLAKTLNCTHALKIRTDMVITAFYPKLWIFFLNRFNKRFVSTPYRCATAKPDFLSSICDYFNFGKVSDMLDLWKVNDIDLLREDFQLPNSVDLNSINFNINVENYSAESELYAHFANSRICKDLKLREHKQIIRKLFFLMPITSLGIIWYGNNNTFRTVYPGSEHPWWSLLNYFIPPTYFYPNYKYNYFWPLKIRKYFSKIMYIFDSLYQNILNNFI